MKKKMKTYILVALCVICTVAVNFIPSSNGNSIGDYIKDKIAPIGVTVVITAVTVGKAVYDILTPIISKIKSASDKFDAATSEVTGSAENGKESIETLKSVAEEMRLQLQENKKSMQIMDKHCKELEKILLLGFCNVDELVKKGTAKEIEKVGETYESEQI